MTLILMQGCYYKSNQKPAEAPSEPVINAVPEAVETEPVKPEPIKPEPIKPEPIKPEPIKPEPVKPEPVKPEPVKPEPVKPEPVKPEHVAPKPAPANATLTIKGQIALDQSKLKEPNAELTNTIVYFEPADPLNTKLPTTDAVISTLNKQFDPSVLAITAGSTVSFPNMDRILHNVFSVSPTSEFDLGLYSAGLAKDVVFEKPGVIYVHCNVHHSMQADILVLETPFFTQVDQNGSFELTNIPQAAGKLKIWHPRANIKTLDLTPENDHKNIKQSIIITRPEVPKHRNKFGKSYRRTRY
ncbi:hypothetical protein OS175_13395 [Marinicella sp. S1101]|uniref:hypothetical protein n=1 Tax=Marinicella marina TaxID=2996016 RepID=UPI00226098DE|nr:hypothetical protein [Marinicella marina]MCX7554869.1 hypothetical protein [Marinicella marina]MDJ1141527.1 hypothetical protein [Marinicella marina]